MARLLHAALELRLLATGRDLQGCPWCRSTWARQVGVRRRNTTGRATFKRAASRLLYRQQ